MNSKYFIMAVSALALMNPLSASAETVRDTNEVRAEKASSGNMSADAKEAWKDVKHDAKEASREVKAFFMGDEENVPAKELSFKSASSASGLIGAAVHNSKNERVGTVKDIIVGENGEASFAVIADGEFPGFDGKLVAFPFADITKKTNDGDVIAPLSEKTIEAATEFQYEAAAGTPNIRTMPTGSYSVAKLLDGEVLASNKEKVGTVEDVYFKGGDAAMIIVGFDKVVGMGGKKVVADFAPATIVNDDGDLDVQLSAKQSSSLESYKQVATK